jgi:hypothetical protein
MKVVSLVWLLITFFTLGCAERGQAELTPTSTARDSAVAIASATVVVTMRAPTATRVVPSVTPTPAPVVATALADIEVHVGPEDKSFVVGVLPAGSAVQAFGLDKSLAKPGVRTGWLALPGLGWIRSDATSVAINGTLSKDQFLFFAFTMAPLSAPHPAGYRTGVARYDKVIALMEAADGDGLRDLIRGVTFPCYATPPLGIGPAPLCPPGVPANTGMEGIVFGSCEGSFLPRDQAFRRFNSALRFFAAESVADDGDYLIFTAGNTGELTIGIRPDGRISSARAGCGTFTSSISSYAVPPLKPSQLR